MTDRKSGLNSAELFTLAQTMRDQNKAPDELMSYSEHAAATATYAMINAFESMAAGLWAVEQRQLEEAKARFLAQAKRMRDTPMLHVVPSNKKDRG